MPLEEASRVPPTVAPNDFTHLHVHSEFSLLDGLARIGDLVDGAANLGFDSLALTDHGALYGAVAFYQACRAREIKPIVGVETYVARRSMLDRDGKADAQPFHLILLAKDWTGYRNLCRIATDAHLDGYYYKPRIDREHLARHSEGLIGLSACLNGEVARALAAAAEAQVQRRHDEQVEQRRRHEPTEDDDGHRVLDLVAGNATGNHQGDDGQCCR